MAWFRVDDSFQGHPKAVGISNDSLATWTRGGQWCAWQLTDGVFQRAQIAGFAADAVDPDAVERDLVHRRLWEAGPEPGTLQFHDWEDWQPTREQVITRRKADAKRKAEARARKDSARTPPVTPPVTGPAASRRESGGSPAVTPHGIRGESALPDPTRPSHIEDIVRTTRTGSGADSERTPDDDDDSLDQLDNMIVAMLAAHGAVTRQQATAWRLALMAAKPLSDPRAYIARTIRNDPQAVRRQVLACKVPGPSRQPPASGHVCRRCGKTDHPTEACPTAAEATPADDVAGVREQGGPAMARKLLGQAQPVDPEPADEADLVDADLPDW